MVDRVIRRLLRRIPLAVLRERSAGTGLRRALGARDLVALGVGVIVGGGIFTTIGPGVHKAGPAVTIAFLLAGLASLAAALCYAELATIMPSAGSAYAFTYGAFGQIFGWIIGWNLVLEYTVGTAPVAQQFSQSLQEAAAALTGVHVPAALSKAVFHAAGSSFDVVAAAFILTLTMLVALGIRETAAVNNALVIVKVFALLVFVFAGALLFDARNVRPFNPVGWIGPLDNDAIPTGIFGAGALVFFTYIGFDVVTTAVEECRDPARDMPAGVIGSLAISTLLYCAVAIVLVGAVPWRDVNVDTPLQSALERLHTPWAAWVTRVGVLAGTSSVALVSLLGQSRIFFAMSRDRLLPRSVATISRRLRTPARLTLVAGGAVAVFALIVPLDFLLAIVNIGTMSAFVAVCAAVLHLRRTQPELPRPFRVPCAPFVATFGIVLTTLLGTFGLGAPTFITFGIWILAGLAIYFAYGYRQPLPVPDAERAV